jgi:excisionase family DNA binding protein
VLINALSYTVPEAARIVGVTPPTLYKAIESGRLKAFRIWERGDQRIHRDVLDAFMRGETSDSAA